MFYNTGFQYPTGFFGSGVKLEDCKFSEEDKKILRESFEKAYSTSSTSTDPISFSGGSSSRGNVGDSLNISPKSIPQSDVKEHVEKVTGDTDLYLANQQINGLRVKKDELNKQISDKERERDELGKKKPEGYKEQIKKINREIAQIKAKVKNIQNAINAFSTLMSGTSAVKPENRNEIIKKQKEAIGQIRNLSASTGGFVEQTDIDDILSAAEAAYSYKAEKADELARDYATRYIDASNRNSADEDKDPVANRVAEYSDFLSTDDDIETEAPSAETVTATNGAVSSTPAATTVTKKKIDNSAQIKRLNETIKTQQAKDEKAKEEKEKKIQEQYDVYSFLAGKTTPRTREEFIELQKNIENILRSNPKGYELKADGQPTLKVSDKQLKDALAHVKSKIESGIFQYGRGDEPSKSARQILIDNGADDDLYYKILNMSDQQIIDLINDNDGGLNFNTANHWWNNKQNIVERLYDFVDDDKSIAVLAGRLAGLKKQQGQPLTAKEQAFYNLIYNNDGTIKQHTDSKFKADTLESTTERELNYQGDFQTYWNDIIGSIKRNSQIKNMPKITVPDGFNADNAEKYLPADNTSKEVLNYQKQLSDKIFRQLASNIESSQENWETEVSSMVDSLGAQLSDGQKAELKEKIKTAITTKPKQPTQPKKPAVTVSVELPKNANAKKTEVEVEITGPVGPRVELANSGTNTNGFVLGSLTTGSQTNLYPSLAISTNGIDVAGLIPNGTNSFGRITAPITQAATNNQLIVATNDKFTTAMNRFKNAYKQFKAGKMTQKHYEKFINQLENSIPQAEQDKFCEAMKQYEAEHSK